MGRTMLTNVTADTVDQIPLGAGVFYRDFVDSGDYGNALGASREGGEFDPGVTYYDMPFDGILGKLEGGRLLQRCEPTLKVNLAEATLANLQLAMAGQDTAGAGALVRVPADVIGEGDGATTDFSTHTNLAGYPQVWVKPAAGGEPVLKTRGTHYTVVLATGVVTFTAGNLPALNDQVIADYTYDSGGAATLNRIVPRNIADGDYVSNLALILPISGAVTESGLVIVLHKALSNGGWRLATKDGEGGVIECTFEGFFPKATPSTMPFSVYRAVA